MAKYDRQILAASLERGLSPDEMVVLAQLGGFKLAWGYIPNHRTWLHEWLLELNSYSGGDLSFVVAWVNASERISHCLFAEYCAPKDFDGEFFSAFEIGLEYHAEMGKGPKGS